jgi:nitrile hydratase
MSTGYHDYGGKDAPPFTKETHDPTFWEQRIDALLELLGDPRRRLMRLDEFRWMNETMGADDYERLTYYERWVHSITRLMIKKGVVTREEVDARMEALRDHKGESK